MAQSFRTLHELGSITLAAGGDLNIGGEGQGATISFDGTDTLNVDGGAANDTLRVGETTQMDVQMDGATDLLFDASAGSLTNGGMFAGFLPDAAIQALSGPGAVNVTSALTEVTTTGADALTLADGTVVGQVKNIIMVADGGTGTLTPANFADGSTIAFDDVGDHVSLMWNGSAWRTVLNVGCTIA